MVTKSTKSTMARRTRPLLAAVMAFLLVLGWQVGHPPAAFADGPTTFSNDTAIAIPASGSAQQIGPASPYPSSITVSGMSGPISKVTVTFHNLTHGSLNDIDAMVVAPDGENLIVLSDAANENTYTYASNATLTFDDAAANRVPGAGQVSTGSYKPTNNPVGSADTFPASAPTPSNETTLAGAFTGIDDANGTWRLYVVDDATGDLGSMAGGWSLTITTETAAASTTTSVTSSDATSTTGDEVTFAASVRSGGSAVTSGTVQFSADGDDIGSPVSLNGSGNASLSTSSLTEGTHLIRATYSGATGFLTSTGTVSQRVDNATTVTGNLYCNTGTITVPNAGSASPYPSNIKVSGLGGNVTKVTAELKGLSHQTPIDLDILLSGPTPTKNVFLLSDGGGQSPVSNVNLTFDDDAASQVSATSLTSGTFRPTRIADESTENLPAPAPALSSATALSTFNGAGGNGTWSLWVFDDATGDAGSIQGGWCLRILSQAATSTALTATPNPSGFGQSVTFTATVTSGGDPVTSGTVQFADDGTDLGAAVSVAADGTATYTTSALTAGTHPITATYSGTDDYAGSTGSRSQVVSKATTTTALVSSGTPSQVGSSVTFTATVTTGANPVGTGSVTFSIDGSDQPAVAVNGSGVATLTTSALTVGTHTIEASYGGTANYDSSDDDLDQVVSALESTTVVVSAPNPSVYGSDATFTATVTSGGSPVTSGTVQFSEGGTSYGPPVPLAGDGTASLTADQLPVGTHTITATFSGTSTIDGGTGSVDHVVTPAPSAVTLTSSGSPVDLGDSVTFTATVRGNGAPLTTGSVAFLVDGTEVGVDEVDSSGEATFTTSALPAGSHQVVAHYEGSANYAEADSAPLTQVVRLIAEAGGPYTVAEGDPLTLDGRDSSPGVDYAWDVNDDGTFDADGAQPTLTWAQLEALGIDDGPGVHTVRLRVTADGVTLDGTAALTVVNSSPATVLTGDLTATAGVPFTIKVGADDPSSADMAAMFTYTVDWGDGSPVETVVGPADPPVTHTYATPGSYDASFTATDKDGGTGAPNSVVVLAGAPSPSPTPTSTSTSNPRPTATATSDGLPQTGTSAQPGMLLAGLGLLVIGAVVTVASLVLRRRRQ